MLLFLSSITILSLAASAGPDSETTPTVAPTTISVRIVSASMETVTDELVVQCQITNKSHDTVVVTPVLEVPETLVVGPRTSKVQRINEATALVKESFDLSSGELKEVTFKLPALGWRDALGLLFFRYGARELRFYVRYELTPGIAEHNQPIATWVIMPQSPLFGVCLGALLGVIATVAFFMAQSLASRQPAMGIKEAVPILLMGSITVIIAAVLLRFSSVSLPQLPISLNVKDFIGGIVLGVLFQPMADWFARVARTDTNRRRRDDGNVTMPRT